MKKIFTMRAMLLTLAFCVFLILSNLMEIKIIQIGPLTATAGLIVFPISYIINDCIVEVYGFRMARLVIWLGFLCNFIMVMFLQIAIALPGADVWDGQEAIVAVWSSTPRILLGSFTAFICGSMVNAYVMSKMKVGSAGKRFSLRAIVSTIFGESIDSMIFFPLAFAGVYPIATIITLIWTQAVLKTFYEIIALPITTRVVNSLKKAENIDTYDNNINYKWWKITDI